MGDIAQKTERDLLIELSTKVDLRHELADQRMATHMTDDTRQFTDINNKMTSFHSRMDKLGITISKFNSMKDKFLGGIAVIGFLFGITMTIIGAWKH